MDSISSKPIVNEADSRKKKVVSNISPPASLQPSSIKSRNMINSCSNLNQDTSKLLTKPQRFRTVSEQRILKIHSNSSILLKTINLKNEIKPTPKLLDRPLPNHLRISCTLQQPHHSLPSQVSHLKATADKKAAKNIEFSQSLSLLTKETQPSSISLQKKSDIAKHRYLVYEGNNSELIKNLLDLRSNWYEGYYSMPNAASFIWSPTSCNIRFKRLKPSCSMQFVNHFEYHGEISNKSRLFNNLNTYCNANKLAVSNIVPATFVIDFKNGYYDELRAFKKFMINASCKSLPSTHYVGKNIWIMKPAGFNRGRGISVFNDLDVLDELTKEILSSKKPGSNVYIIQKYIEKPLLVNSRKFDVRVWVLVCQNDNCYFFPQGYLRTSSQPFTLDHLESKFIHLTNNAIQKDGAEYGKFEAGNQMSFQNFQRYLSSTHKAAKLSRVTKQMKQQVIVSLQAAKGKLNPKSRQGCFEIFGYDFIIDSDLKTWLIEVNTNPCLELSSPLLEQIIPRMLNDALELTIGSIFLSDRKPLYTPSIIDLPSENLWEFLINIGAS